MTDKEIRLSVYRGWVDGIRRREEMLGIEKLPDGPTSEALDALLIHIEELVFQSADTASAAAVSDLIKNIEVVSDSWLFPEKDPVGIEAVDYLNDMHRSLARSLSIAIPELAELQQRTDSLRWVSQAAKRSLEIEKQNHPNGTMLQRIMNFFSKRVVP